MGTRGIIMCRITSDGLNNGITIISNRFIDEYLVDASGLNLKVYLYLLRYTYVPSADISLAGIAGALDYTPNQIMKALKYWQKLSLLDFALDEKGEIKHIRIADVNTVAAAPTAEAAVAAEVSAKAEKGRDTKHNITDTAAPASSAVPKVFPDYSPEQLNDIIEEEHFKALIGEVEKLLVPNNVGYTEIKTLAGIYEGYGFSDDLILYLYKYCHDKGIHEHKYIEQVATNWAEKNICTVEQAQFEEQFYSKLKNDIRRALGKTNAFSDKQLKEIEKWIYQYRLPDDVIIAAFQKAGYLDKPFVYAASILEGWHKDGIKTLDDIKKHDELYSAESARKTGTRKTSDRKNSQAPAYNQFNDFRQRTYSKEEESALEKQLILNNAHSQEELDSLEERLRKA